MFPNVSKKQLTIEIRQTSAELEFCAETFESVNSLATSLAVIAIKLLLDVLTLLCVAKVFQSEVSDLLSIFLEPFCFGEKHKKVDENI